MRQDDAGFTLVEVVVAMGIAGVLLTGFTSLYLSIGRRSADSGIEARAQIEATTLIKFLSKEIQDIGSGMPLNQKNFAWGTPGLGNNPLPVLPSSSDTTLVFRKAITGESTVLTADFTVGGGSTALSVLSAASLKSGTDIYISNFPRGEEDGLKGRVLNVVGSNVTLSSNIFGIDGSQFKRGSILTAVETVTYDGSNQEIGVVRSERGTDQIVAPRSSLTIEYFDGQLNPIALPLSSKEIALELSMIRLRVTVMSRQLRSDGSAFSAKSTADIHLRHLTAGRL